MENWAKNIIRNYGSVGKIAFVNKEPVALTIHYPAWEDPLMGNMKRSLYLQCVYNPNPRYQRQGIGKALIKAVIQYAEKAGLYDYIITYAFNTAPANGMGRNYGLTGPHHSVNTDRLKKLEKRLYITHPPAISPTYMPPRLQGSSRISCLQNMISL